ncbi:hypothetical protein CLV51_1044 [Chitinophaga niastensis]|uniref:Uncharacterized protein n=1 Tax=Chitinophaga niastensis TaxID=536980 RepID=A0A2P8HGF5_CHINA|nr:hypothetical protein [Chitinophaga niastensis]PSL45302.1 hypothetical protein CLV51_1044 [Chitinophaga niastensis]
MDITNKVLGWIDVMKRRPLMILSDETLSSLKSYIEGFTDGLGHIYDNGKLRLEISLWFQNKINAQSDMLWTNQILSYYSDKTEEELKIIMLQSLEDYFKENPEWYKKR